jgi:hypothetical protein
MINLKLILSCLSFCLLILSCDDKLGEIIDPGLLYVQEVNKGEGITAGQFGEIMVYDLKNEEPFTMLRDKYYNVGPGWIVNGESIFFESKRGENFNYVHLSVNSSIYSYNLKNQGIDNLLSNEISPNKWLQVGDEVRFSNPFLLNDSLLAFSYNYVELNDNIRSRPDLFSGVAVFNLFEQKKVFNLEFGLSTISIKNKINCRGNILAIELLQKRKSLIKIYNLKQEGDSLVTEIQGNEEESINLGQWDEKTKSFYVSISNYKTDKSKIISYSPMNDSKQVLFETKDLIASDPVRVGDLIYFIGTDTFDYDIYSYNITNQELNKLTFDTLFKTDLSGPNFCE